MGQGERRGQGGRGWVTWDTERGRDRDEGGTGNMGQGERRGQGGRGDG